MAIKRNPTTGGDLNKILDTIIKEVNQLREDIGGFATQISSLETALEAVEPVLLTDAQFRALSTSYIPGKMYILTDTNIVHVAETHIVTHQLN